MKKILTLLFFASVFLTCAAQQVKENAENAPAFQKHKYLTFNPFGLVEPQMAVGAGFINHFTERSEYFTELSYIFKSPIYTHIEYKVSGYRLLAQYRYHLFQKGKPLVNILTKSKITRQKNSQWLGTEFRLKGFNFSDKYNFINESSAVIIYNYLYQAGAVVIGGALIYGGSFALSKNGKLNLEVISGLGAKVKFVKYKNIPPGYTPLHRRGGSGYAIPDINKALGSPYFPFCIRIKYLLD